MGGKPENPTMPVGNWRCGCGQAFMFGDIDSIPDEFWNCTPEYHQAEADKRHLEATDPLSPRAPHADGTVLRDDDGFLWKIQDGRVYELRPCCSYSWNQYLELDGTPGNVVS